MSDTDSSILVLVVYDQPALRASYVTAVRALTPYQAVGVASAEDALREAENTLPGAFLLDARLPLRAAGQPTYADGRQLLLAIRKRWPDIPVLVTSVVWTPYLLWHSVRQGAAGVLRDDIDFPELAAAIRAVVADGVYRARDDDRQLAVMDQMNVTAQDQRILLMKREGLSHQDIADTLHLSRHTIRTHFQKLAQKLGVEGENEGQIVHRASELGLLQFP
jgi:DNA-binding NarL/FixJ family response regulator